MLSCVMPDDSITGNVGGRPAGTVSQLPDGAVSPRVAQLRSRIGLWAPALSMPVVLAGSALAVAFAHAPPDIGVFAIFCGVAQGFLLRPRRAKGRRRPARLDTDQLLLTGRTWTGARTVDLTKLARVSRVEWIFRSEYGATRTVDFVICADSAGARLALPRPAAEDPVRRALDYQRQHHLEPARVSRFAAMGLGLAEYSLLFLLARTAVLVAAVFGYCALVCWLMLTAIPSLAPGH
jgi:hypothetical protein